MNIRFIQKKDVKELLELCKLHAIYEKSDFNSKGKEKLFLECFFKKPLTVNCLVAEDKDEIVGYSTFMKQFSTWDAEFYMYLDCLFLMEKIRGKGVGVKMMNKIKMHAKSENCTSIQWQTPSFNKEAIQFYQKVGAKYKTKERFLWSGI
ncbi:MULTISPECIES: GNAT family N-acetyltransferase [Tenacibaculum]|uniref:GNAT family N-acetyltransferase n=1 Tax=Tenacibaculum TaxID=104267 RepID=UPI00089CFF74|nr:GNAT family N-acetyltransferase [Tenacibaculum sp. MAR_2010_89]SEE62512.1 Acetyltransferase (GNAT) family protein [Tenacibaculum sp. MAR_2010_89]